MTLLRRRPREVYRVYAEDEFLGIDEWPLQADWDLAPVALDEPASAPAGRGAPRRRLRQAVAIAVPAAMAMTVGAIVVHDLRSGTAGVRRRASLRSPVDRSLADNNPPRNRGALRPAPRRHPAARRGAHRPIARAASAPVATTVAESSPPPRALSASTATDTPAHAPVVPRTRPEFGFER